MTEPTIRVLVKDLYKEYLVRDHSAGSLKTKILWWKKGAEVRSAREVKQVIKGISFEVRAGECLAIIGRNGAGKSTTLGVLAKVLLPTSGTVEMNGRIAPLLELGAGFHPDLSGRDNVVFNGMLLGLSEKEVLSRMEQIIDFAEVREFIDLPVRTYSSGMKARLGFAVAAHVDADILIVDEALSVGDFRFVKKCEDHMRQFQAEGGTILFVSHGLQGIKNIATRCIWIENGVIAAEGDPEQVIASYRGDPKVQAQGIPGPGQPRVALGQANAQMQQQAKQGQMAQKPAAKGPAAPGAAKPSASAPPVASESQAVKPLAPEEKVSSVPQSN